MTTATEIEARLRPLVGLRLWGLTRAATLASFQFGPCRLVTQQAGPRAGMQKEVGSHALHVQCAWRIHRRAASPEESAEPEQDRSAEGVAGSDALLDAFFQNVCPIVVVAVRADKAGGLQIELEEDYVVEVCPDEHEGGELWRFFSPYEANAHVVFSDGQLCDE